jgi:membrane protein DedA with SNARE-associated domain
VMEDLFLRFGLVAIYIGAAIEGDMILVLSGVIAHLGYISLPRAMGIGAAGCLTGDVVWYVAGRIQSESIKSTRIYRAVGPAVERAAKRVGPWHIAASRFLYGTRIATMVFWGIRRLSFPRFVLIDFVSCAVWAVLLGTLGYAASSGAMLVLGEIKRVELWLLGAVVACLIVFSTIRIVCGKARQKIGRKQ